MKFERRDSKYWLRAISKEGYIITAAASPDPDVLEPWWVANGPMNQPVGSGYGEPGLNKCIELCEVHERENEAT